MKIAITGHTSGLGKTLALELKKTHQIIGFSRKNIPIENYKKIARGILIQQKKKNMNKLGIF